eukprot:23837-Chlamydomonas_euryale.AAC.1
MATGQDSSPAVVSPLLPLSPNVPYPPKTGAHPAAESARRPSSQRQPGLACQGRHRPNHPSLPLQHACMHACIHRLPWPSNIQQPGRASGRGAPSRAAAPLAMRVCPRLMSCVRVPAS